jgi:DNA-3-methyladenine glycosylase II
MRARQPGGVSREEPLRIPTLLHGSPTIVEVTTDASGPVLHATSRPDADPAEVRAIVEWALFAALDLSSFYEFINRDSRLAPLVTELHGLKRMRPVTLFEMAVIAITEQQVSLASAYYVRERLVRTFGRKVEDLWVFPTPQVLAAATLEELRSIGLTRQKADYIKTLAVRIASGELDLNRLKSMSDAAAKETIIEWRGFGAWSADYMLVRGLARPDAVPYGDIAIRDVVGKYLGDGSRVASEDVDALLEPFRPWRGLLVFYLLAHGRLRQRARDTHYVTRRE